MDRLKTMEIFIQVAQMLSFSRAAEVLQLPRSSVSNAIQSLEAHLQTRLLHRTTRKIQLTADGEMYYDWCRRLLADIEDTEQRLRVGSSSPRGRLRVSVPSRLASHLIAPQLQHFLQLYPELELEISSTDRPVDLIPEGIDCAIRVGNLHDENLVVRHLGILPQGTYASPAYIEQHGLPTSLDELEAHQSIHYLSPASGRLLELDFVVDEQMVRVKMSGRLAVNSVESYIACCCAGLGLIQIPKFDAAELIRQGKLTEVLPELAPEPMPIAAVYPDRRYVSRRVRVFIAWMQQLIQKGCC
ncbi:LysR family transcriptional regulator [Alkalimonas amylolytica]|uniref:LysR family transcriptional regulator, regulator for bpeEF and oprC n=1 Tax=Alkalimonas amylolytica TaxID=152573 RepID=A0A1H4D9E3_ALKAM|nr:LysR family transcriptional regulator [Alkalimonas amylolytica]SEA69168.1 LysR family transcriptional regulator, regulator for bpeEF and oprC [Alkalimonas amylolytica]